MNDATDTQATDAETTQAGVVETGAVEPAAPLAGFMHHLRETEYHAHPSISSGFVRTLLERSPAHARHQRDNPPDATPALLFGRAVHARILEPESFAERFAIAPKVDRRTKEGKATWAAFVETHPDASHLSEADGEMVTEIAESVFRHRLASPLLTDGAQEMSGFWTDPETDIHCRCRFDWLRYDRIGVDLKTTADASPDAFACSIAKYGYHVQAAWYAMGYEAITGEALTDFVFLCVEKAAPYAVGVYRIDSAALALGERQARRALAIIAECQARDHWPAYPDSVEPVSVPEWLWRAAEMEEGE